MSYVIHPVASVLRRSRAVAILLLVMTGLLGGCATTHPGDPLEPMNRAIYSFNDGVDNAIFKPVAQGYRAVLPQFARTGVSNFFSNINDVLVALNNLLQGKVVNALSDVGRVVVNSTIGIAGFIDVATHFGLEKHNEDFGQTLGRWGIGDGPYIVLPFLGPSNLRDTVARVVDSRADPVRYVRSMRLRNSLWGTRAVNDRANLLDATKILETAALDAYEFVRDAYIQRRRNLIFDGAPPREKDAGAAQPAVVQSPFPADASMPDNYQTVFAPGAVVVPAARPADWTPARDEAIEQAEAPESVPPAQAVTNQAPAPAASLVPPAAPVTTSAPAAPIAPTALTPTQEVELPTAPTGAGIPAEAEPAAAVPAEQTGETASVPVQMQRAVRIWM